MLKILLLLTFVCYNNAQVIISNDFDGNSVGALTIVGGTFDTGCGVVSGSNALRFNGGSERSVTTAPFQGPAQIAFSIVFGTGDSPCENANSGEDVVLESSIDGSTWTLEREFGENDFTAFTPTSTTVLVPAATLQLRLRQIAFSGTFDNWAIDDLVVSCEPVVAAATPTYLPSPTIAAPRRSTVTVLFTNCDSVTGTQFTLSVTGDTSAVQFVSSTYPAGGCSINGCGNAVTIPNTQHLTFQFVVDVRKIGSVNLVFEMVASGGVFVDSDSVTFESGLACLFDDFGGGNAFGPTLQLSGHRFGNECGGPSNAVTFDRNAQRQLLTPDLFGPRRVSFDLRVGDIGSCEEVDDDDNEVVVLEYSIDGGSFVEHRRFPHSALTIVDETLPEFPSDKPVQIRVRQLENSGANTDEWSVHDFSVSCARPPVQLTIQLDTQPDNGADVHFTHNIVPGGEFSLDDDADAALDNQVELEPDTPGQYRVTLQGLPPKHTLQSIECDSNAVTIDLEQRRVLVDFKASDVVCKFVVVGLGSCCSHRAVDGCVANISEKQCLTIDRQATWTFDGDCGQDECPRGACCLPFGHCNDRFSPTVCATKKGSFNGLATKCEEKTCGACCGGDTVDGCSDDTARSLCDSTAAHVPNRRCAQSCGACCEDTNCVPRAQTSLNGKPCASFILGDYKCSKQCGSCCGGANCKDNQFESQCGFDGLFSNGTCADTCGACCDNGTCQVTIGEDECSEGVFQGEGSNCGDGTCPLGNVCCQNDEDQPCLTDIDAVEECTGAGQFAAENCNECLVRFAQLNLIVSSESNEISLSGADARKRNVESSSSSSSTSSSSYSSSSSSKSSRCSSSSSSSSSSSNNDCPLSIDMNVVVNNASPLTFNNVVIDVFVTMPRTAVVSSVNAEIGTFQWTKHTLHDSQVTGHGQWTIATLVGGDHPQLLFDVELKQPHVGENVQMHTALVSSEPSATSSAQEFIVTLIE